MLTLITFTNIPYVLSERILHPSYLLSPIHVRSYFLDYIASLSAEYHGPVEGIVSFFGKRKIERATLYTDYEVDSLKFYFPSYYFVSRNLIVVKNKPQPMLVENYADITDFYIPRTFWGDLGRIGECEKAIIKRGFTKHILPYYDLEWNNLPDITYHKFFLDKNLPPLVIYEKNGNVNFSACKV